MKVVYRDDQDRPMHAENTLAQYPCYMTAGQNQAYPAVPRHAHQWTRFWPARISTLAAIRSILCVNPDQASGGYFYDNYRGADIDRCCRRIATCLGYYTSHVGKGE